MRWDLILHGVDEKVEKASDEAIAAIKSKFDDVVQGLDHTVRGTFTAGSISSDIIHVAEAADPEVATVLNELKTAETDVERVLDEHKSEEQTVAPAQDNATTSTPAPDTTTVTQVNAGPSA